MRTMPNSRKGTGTLTKTRTETLTAETRTGTETGKGNGNKNGKRRRSIAPCDHEAESCGMCHVLLPCTARRAACRNPWATDPLGAHSAPGVINAMRPLCNNSNKNKHNDNGNPMKPNNSGRNAEAQTTSGTLWSDRARQANVRSP